MADQYYNGDGRYYPPYTNEQNPYAPPQGMTPQQGMAPYTYDPQYAYGAPYGGYVPQYDTAYQQSQQPYAPYMPDYASQQPAYSQQAPYATPQQGYPYGMSPDYGYAQQRYPAYAPTYEPYGVPVQQTYTVPTQEQPAPYAPAYTPAPWAEQPQPYPQTGPAAYDSRMMPARQQPTVPPSVLQAMPQHEPVPQPAYTPAYYPEAQTLPPVAPVEAFVPPRVLPYMQQDVAPVSSAPDETSAVAPPAPAEEVKPAATAAPVEAPPPVMAPPTVEKKPVEETVAVVKETPVQEEVPAQKAPEADTVVPTEQATQTDDDKAYSSEEPSEPAVDTIRVVGSETAVAIEPADAPQAEDTQEIDLLAAFEQTPDPIALTEVIPETIVPAQAEQEELFKFEELPEQPGTPTDFQVALVNGMDPFASADVPTMEAGTFEDVFSRVTEENDPNLALQNTQQVSRVADELSRSVLMNSYRNIFTDNNLAVPRRDICLRAQGITADLFLMRDGGRPYLMFDNVDVTVRSGACVAVVADVGLAAYGLLKKIGELSDVYAEEISVEAAEDGFEREILYIGGDEMLPDNVTVMQFLLMATRRSSEKTKDRAQHFSVLLGQMGLGGIELENTKKLSHLRRVMILLLGAALNEEIGCILLNDPMLEMTQGDKLVVRRMFAFLKDAGKGVILAGCDNGLMAAVANYVLALRDGRVVFDDTYKRFIDRNCTGILSFTSEIPDVAVSYFVEKHPEVSALSNGNLVYLMRRRDDDIDLEQLVKDALAHGADAHSVVLDEKSFDIACREVLKGI